MKLSKAQIGRCGELLVQFKLLNRGIESAPLTTDSGLDLIAYSTRLKRAKTIQVKTNHIAKQAGGKGKLHLDWWIADDSEADIFAFVNLDSLRVWLVETAKIPSIAQQHPKGRFHFFMAVDSCVKPRRDGKRIYEHEFSEFLFENAVSVMF